MPQPLRPMCSGAVTAGATPKDSWSGELVSALAVPRKPPQSALIEGPPRGTGMSSFRMKCAGTEISGPRWWRPGLGSLGGDATAGPEPALLGPLLLRMPWAGLQAPGSHHPPKRERDPESPGEGSLCSRTNTQRIDTPALETMCFISNLIPRETPPWVVEKLQTLRFGSRQC